MSIKFVDNLEWVASRMRIVSVSIIVSVGAVSMIGLYRQLKMCIVQ